MLLDSDKNRIRHMVEAANQALQYSEGRYRSDLETDPPLQHLLTRNLEILGEAASRVSQELRAGHPEIPWRDMIEMRNRLIPAYFDVDTDIIWSTVQRALPTLLAQLQAILGANEMTWLRNPAHFRRRDADRITSWSRSTVTSTLPPKSSPHQDSPDPLGSRTDGSLTAIPGRWRLCLPYGRC